MELFDHLRKISFIFFAVTGLVHFIAGLLYVNGYATEVSGVINRVMFIPFVLATLTYGLSNFKYHLLSYGKDSKTWNYIFISGGVVVFIILLAIELLVVDSPTPLTPQGHVSPERHADS